MFDFREILCAAVSHFKAPSCCFNFGVVILHTPAQKANTAQENRQSAAIAVDWSAFHRIRVRLSRLFRFILFAS